jgi:putative nucleotidyltransferase with HDIG domain
VALCIGTLPFLEAVFGIVTPIKMLDLTNPNNKLLRRLTIEAPGTYQHSLIVGNLAETAAFDVGADPTLARVGGYYHDIGKLEYPQYFSENQISDNPHDVLDPYVSAQILTGHISKGIEMAEENRLPHRIVDIVEQHHGTTLIKFFYYKATKQYPDKIINESDFRYNYKIPQSKESAIVMLADTVEAAVRSMAKGKTNEEVDAFVRTLIKDKLDDGQLLDSMLTIKDLDTIAVAFMRVFKGMYHERIPYPKTTMAELKTNEKSEAPEEDSEEAADFEEAMETAAGDEGAV